MVDDLGEYLGCTRSAYSQLTFVGCCHHQRHRFHFRRTAGNFPESFIDHEYWWSWIQVRSSDPAGYIRAWATPTTATTLTAARCSMTVGRFELGESRGEMYSAYCINIFTCLRWIPPADRNIGVRRMLKFCLDIVESFEKRVFIICSS